MAAARHTALLDAAFDLIFVSSFDAPLIRHGAPLLRVAAADISLISSPLPAPRLLFFLLSCRVYYSPRATFSRHAAALLPLTI